MRIIPLLIMITFAPPATVSAARGGDVGQRLQERGRRHPVVERADDRDARRVDHPLQPHRLAYLCRHVYLLPGPRRTTVNSNAPARWYSCEESTGAPSSP